MFCGPSPSVLPLADPRAFLGLRSGRDKPKALLFPGYPIQLSSTRQLGVLSSRLGFAGFSWAHAAKGAGRRKARVTGQQAASCEGHIVSSRVQNVLLLGCSCGGGFGQPISKHVGREKNSRRQRVQRHQNVLPPVSAEDRAIQEARQSEHRAYKICL